MFITRATRHDRGDIEEFLRAQGWTGADLAGGSTFFARDGGVVGCVRLVELEPATVVVTDMVVDRARRREGIGTSLMQAAMNSRGGTLYLRCDREHAGFFEGLGFAEVGEGDLPGSVRERLGAPDAGAHEVLLRAR